MDRWSRDQPQPGSLFQRLREAEKRDPGNEVGFSATIASRFEIVDEEYIEELKDKSENENTKDSTERWENVFKKWANERNLQANLEEYENDVLDKLSSQF